VDDAVPVATAGDGVLLESPRTRKARSTALATSEPVRITFDRLSAEPGAGLGVASGEGFMIDREFD
jgi:hypothetical protein